MKIISWNLNGLMATLKSGSFAPLAEIAPDVLCLQEIRTDQEPEIFDGYCHFWNHAKRSGYAGTAILTKETPICVKRGFPSGFLDEDGRIMTAELSGCYIVNVYVPNSQKNLKRRRYRMEWDEALIEYVCDLKGSKPVIICGDFNVAREEIDIYEENLRQYWAEQGYASDERSDRRFLCQYSGSRIPAALGRTYSGDFHVG